MAAALAIVLTGIAPGALAADPPAIVVDLDALDTLDTVSGPGWSPPLPAHRPEAPAGPPTPIRAEPAPVAPPAPRVVLPAAATVATAEAVETPARDAVVTTAPVVWQRPIPVTAGVLYAQQVGARSTAPAPSVSDKAVGANVDVEATADMISALPNGDGFRIVFDGDRTALSATGQRLLDTLVERMAVESDLRLNVEAFAGGTPDTAARARLLSLERAMAVRDYLFDRGVRGSRIDIRALGNTSVDGPPERVDLLITN